MTCAPCLPAPGRREVVVARRVAPPSSADPHPAAAARGSARRAGGGALVVVAHGPRPGEAADLARAAARSDAVEAEVVVAPIPLPPSPLRSWVELEAGPDDADASWAYARIRADGIVRELERAGIAATADVVPVALLASRVTRAMSTGVVTALIVAPGRRGAVARRPLRAVRLALLRRRAGRRVRHSSRTGSRPSQPSAVVDTRS